MSPPALNWKSYLLSRLLVVLCTGLALMYVLVEFICHPILFFKRTKRVAVPNCMLDPTLGKHEYADANGIKFHYVTCGDPSKPLMLFLHGFPEFWYSWRHQMKEFSDNYHVVSVDLRGYNQTERSPNVSDYLLTNLCQDIVELISALGHDKAILVAHDWGGAIAWTVAQQHPEVVKKLIVMNCPHPRVIKRRAKRLSQLWKSWYVFFFQVPWLPEFIFSTKDFGTFDECFLGEYSGVRNKRLGAFTAEDVEAYKYVFSQDGALTSPINYYRANALQASVGDKKSTIDIPTLIIWGDADRFFDVAMADGHMGVVSDLTVRHIEDCSHWVQNDDPERVNQYMREFLE